MKMVDLIISLRVLVKFSANGINMKIKYTIHPT